MAGQGFIVDVAQSAVSGAPASSAGRRCYVAVLFSDLCGSTSLAADHDADTYAEILEALRTAGHAIMANHGGEIAQVYGDGILSIFQGADGAERAAAAALRLHASVAALALPNGIRGLRMHSGIHSGLVLLRPGDPTRGTIEAVGHTTSVAARLSAAAQPNEILVSSGSISQGQAAFPTGKARPVDIGDGSPPISAMPVAALPSPAAAASTPAPRFPFIGRSIALGELAAAQDRLAAGSGFRIAVVAPPGQGKSRLALAFTTRAEAAGITVLRGTCSASPTAGPLLPFHQIAALMSGDGTAVSVDAGPEALVAAIAGRLSKPMIIVLDDWQWADTASVAALARLRDLAGPLGILLLSRERAVSALPLEGFEAIALPPLSIEETAALVQSRRPEFDPIDARRVHDRSGGNPLFAEELCLVDPRATRNIPRAGTETVASGWLASLVGARFDLLTKPAQRVLENAAVIGLSPPRWLLDALVGADAAAAAIPLLIKQDFLAASDSEGGVRFKHGITWEIIYSLIPLETRRRLHAGIAEVLEQRTSTPEIDLAESLAWHFVASEQPARSWPYAERAGDRATKLGSLDRARAQYRLAIDTLTRLPDDRIDHDRYHKIVGKYGYASIFDAESTQYPVFEAAIDRARSRGDRDAEAAAEYWLGYVAHGAGDTDRATRHCRNALAVTPAATESSFSVQARATLAQVLASAADYAAAIPLLDEAIDIKRRHRSGRQASTGLAYSLSQRAAVAADMGDFTAADAMLDEAIALLNGEAVPVEASIMGILSTVRVWQADWPGLLAAANHGAAAAERIEAVYIHALCRAYAGYARWQIDGIDADADLLAAAVECMVARGKTLALSKSFGFMAEIEVMRGNIGAARRAVAGAYRQARAGDPMGLAMAARAWARQLAPSNPRKAHVYLARARANAAMRQSPHEAACCDLDEVRLDLCRPEDRHALIDRAEAAFTAMGIAPRAAEARALRA